MMSSHSRSSSEVEPLQYSEVLPVFISDFLKDFSFEDVKHRVKELFTKDEYEFIKEEKNEKRQIFRLFWVLCSNDAIIQKFLEIISYDYKWLADKVLRERNSVQSKVTENFLDVLKILRSNHQKHMDYNVHRLEPFMELRRALKKLKPYESVVLTGDLGIGKKWLAFDVCCEFTVLKAMDFKIYPIDVSQCVSPEEDLRMLQYFRLLLNDSNASISSATSGSKNQRDKCEYFDTISNRILDLQQDLRMKLRREEYKNCLLVLKNVQNVRTWKAFNLGCKMLLITRNKKITESLSNTMSTHIKLDTGLTLSEFFFLFEKYLGNTRDKFPPNATDIYYNSNGHPHLLSIIAQNLRQKKSDRKDWDEWIRNLENLTINDNKFTTVIEISLNVLRPELLKLYETFAIFPHSIFIPVRLLATLWNKSLHEAENIVNKFDKHSIVNKDVQPDGATVCRLPFIYSSHLKASNRIKDTAHELHKKVIDYYKIEKAFHQRTEIDLCNSQHDLYFFSCIGYHLHEAGCTELFSQIYLDFGFLEQKIREVGLLNTIGDLRCYEEEIINFDPRCRQLLRDIRDFLPNVEEKLVHSNDTCLLQYALMESGTVYTEALRQVKKFPDKIWFTEKGHFHQRRQIVNLPNQAKIVTFLEQDTCLIVLDNNNMILADISLDCNNGSVFLINDDSKNAAIIEARFFRDDNFILTLDKRCELKLWSISDERRRSLVHRRSSKQKVNPLNFNQHSQIRSNACKQCIQESTIGKRGKVVAFHIEQLPPKYGNTTSLHVAFDNGDVCVYEWNTDREEFQSQHVPILPTRQTDIRFLSKILGKYYMMLNTAGNISFWNLKDSSKVPVSFEWPEHKASLICYEMYTYERHGVTQYTSIVFVFGDKILQLTFEQQKYAVLVGKLETLYEYTDAHSSITCARLSRDGHYLVLGTKCGLIVFDTNSKSEILRSNVSESIACVDIYALDDRVFKYIIICGAEHKKVLNIYALRKNGENSLGWSHKISCISNEDSNIPQLEPDVWLMGQKLYDMTYDEGAVLVAADSKNRIHQVCTTNTKNWSIIMPTETSHRITAITTNKQTSFAGYKNGAIFNINQEVFEPSFTDEPISYLQLMDEHHLIASAKNASKTLIQNFEQNYRKNYDLGTKQCFKVFGHYLLLVDDFGLVLILDIDRKCDLVCARHDISEHEVGTNLLGGCDFQKSLLFLATTTFNIYVYKFTDDDGQFKINPHVIFKKNEVVHAKITCLTVASDASLVAVGLSSGNIEVYRMNENLTFLYRLQSHRDPIYDMKFSPNVDVLVSVSEQLCFWSVAHMLNNPLANNTKRRRSSRFSSQRSSDVEEVDRAVHAPTSNYLQVNGCDESDLTDSTQVKQLTAANTINPWQNKRGPADKPELLACIKFDGNTAEKIFANSDFTQFFTIDDEGVYYHLAVLQLRDNGECSYTNGHNYGAQDMTDEIFYGRDDDNDDVRNAEDVDT